MKKASNLSLFIFLSLLLFTSCSETTPKKIVDDSQLVTFTPPVEEAVAVRRADSIVSVMTLDEKLSLIKGFDGFFIKGFEHYNMPNIYLVDASQGVHIRQSFHGADHTSYALPKSVAFPNLLELAATWNPALASQYAKSIGEECRAAGIGVLLGPGMNIYRNAQCGRNFEYMGEDPFLASRMIERYVVGIQNTGVMATLKHFVANNTDYRRRTSNSIVSERALHEIYLPAFKSGIDAGAMAVMTSYNQVNGEWAGQSDVVINQILRGKLGFNNLVMTDWWSVNDCKKVVKSGQDLEMPGGESMVELKAFVENGEVDIKDIDRMCRSIIKTLTQMNFLDKPIKDTSFLRNFEQHEKIALTTAREGIVLLRNNDILPIEEGSTKNILLTGIYVTENIFGGGSGAVEGYNTVTIMDALTSIYPNLEYAPTPTDEELREADVVFVSVATWDYEGCDRHFALPEDQEKLVQKASQLNENSVVIINSGSAIRMNDWKKVDGIVLNWYPGQIGNVALAEILSGKTNPSGKLPMTIEKEFKDAPAYGYIPEGTEFMCDQPGYLDINIPNSELNRWSFDSRISEADTKMYDIHYSEDVLVGYRWYDTKNIEPLFPFGFGLSYTSFSFDNIALSSTEISPDEVVKVVVDVTNSGERKGATVVQLYVSEQQPTVLRPVKELKGFRRVMLAPGECKSVNIYLTKEAFSFWCSETKQWVCNSGIFDIRIGESSQSLSEPVMVTVNN